MTGGASIDSYEWAGGREAMLRLGPEQGPMVVVALPLFEEANRTRAFTVALLRALAARGIGSVLPDLPGQGESLVPLETVSLAAMRAAHADLVDQLWAGHRPIFSVAIRSGATIDAESHVYGRWHLAPQDGRGLLRELTRIRQASIGAGRKLGEEWSFDLIDADGNDVPAEIAGNLIGPAFLNQLLEPVTPAPGFARTVRLASDARPADRHVEGKPLWRQPEPGSDRPLAELLASDIAHWLASCAG